MAQFYTFAAGKESHGLECCHAAEGLLGQLRCTWLVCRFPVAHLVGAGRDNPDRVRELVGGIPQRLVLKRKCRRGRPRPCEINTSVAALPALSSSGDAPRATGQDISAHTAR